MNTPLWLILHSLLFNVVLQSCATFPSNKSIHQYQPNKVNDIQLYKAVDLGDVQLVRDILTQGVHDVNSYLYSAAGKGYREIVKLLLDNHADPNGQDDEGRTALYWAACNCHKKIIELLLEKKANPNLATQYGWTPLHLAVHTGQTKMIELLLNKGADPNLADKDGETPLHWAAIGGYTDVINVLLRANSDCTIRNKTGNTFLQILAAKEEPKLILEIKQAIEDRHLLFLNNLQKSMHVLCPELSNNDSRPILAGIVDYIQGIPWDLKDN